jgi:hypothetical protein
MKEYGSKGYDFWTALIVGAAILLPHPNDPLVEIELSSFWDRVKPGGAIRVMISIFRLGPPEFRGRVPTASFLVTEDERIIEFRNLDPMLDPGVGDPETCSR